MLGFDCRESNDYQNRWGEFMKLTLVVKTILCSALFLGGCIIGLAILLADELDKTLQIVLANFSVICILIGFLLGFAGIIQCNRENKK